MEKLYTLEEAENNMTIFYSLKTSEIKIMAYGIHDMRYFGKDQYDYNYGVLVIPKDEYIFENQSLFKVVDGEVVLKRESLLNKYKVI